MAAYGEMASLLQILDSVITHPPVNWLQIFRNRERQLQTLRHKVVFLLDFLENSSQRIGKNAAAEILERKIRDTACAAEDHIESQIPNQVASDPETESYTSNTPPMSNPILAVHILIFVMVQETMHPDLDICPFFQKMVSVAIQILMPPVFIISQNGTLIAVQTLIPVTLKNVMFVTVKILMPFLLRILLPVLVLILISIVLSELMHVVVCKGKSVWSQYAKRNSELKDLIEEMNSIMKEVNKINDGTGVNVFLGDMRNAILPAVSSSRRDTIGIDIKNVVVGLESDLTQIKTRLIEASSKIDIVSIVGMGGIGKTTLARQVYDDTYVIKKFDTRAWVTISQEYSLHQVLLDLLDSAKILTEEIKDQSVELLAKHLYKSLKSRRFLIVMDDMWDTEIWDAVKRFFPDDYNGSRILLTTRLLDVALYANSRSPPHRMQFLNEDDSWNLLSKKVFAQEDCPPELTVVGKEIANNCGGLPLAIAVIGGLLYKNSRTQEYWRSIAENLSSFVAKDDKQCMEILSLSYKYLPHRLKTCFLYMGVFPEDYEIPVTKLISLWAAEGFLRSDRSTSLEEVAEEYLKDLIDRSLILVSKQSCNGKIKTCSIHDLLRDICVQIAQKEKNFHVMRRCDDLPQEGANYQRRFIVRTDALQNSLQNSQRRFKVQPDAWHAALISWTIDSTNLARTLLFTGRNSNYTSHFYIRFRLLHILDVLVVHLIEFPVEILELVNLRYLGFTYNGRLHPSISKLLNLQTLIHHNWAFWQRPLLPLEIWKLPNLRHLWLTPTYLPDPLSAHSDENSSFLLEKLQSLLEIRNLKCSKDILGRIPNLKKLVVSYYMSSIVQLQWSEYELEGLENLCHLETLKLMVKNPSNDSDLMYPPKLAFPHNLKNLTLGGCGILWENMSIIGTLPNLEVLKLRKNACRGEEWEPIEGEFYQLKSLSLEELNVVHWRADNTHFPCLQFLTIRCCFNLNEVPSDVGEIPTLQVIELVDCPRSVVNSAKQILEYQQDLGNDELQVRVDPRRWFKDRFNLHDRLLKSVMSN